MAVAAIDLSCLSTAILCRGGNGSSYCRTACHLSAWVAGLNNRDGLCLRSRRQAQVQSDEVAAMRAFVMVVRGRPPHVRDDHVELSVAIHIADRNAAAWQALSKADQRADIDVPGSVP